MAFGFPCYSKPRHSRHLSSGIHLRLFSDGSPLTTCGDDRGDLSFPTCLIGKPSWFLVPLLFKEGLGEVESPSLKSDQLLCSPLTGHDSL